MYIYPTITINGVSSTTIAGLLITSLPPISKPLQRTLVDVIDGRAGDVVTPLGFAAYDKPVGIALTTGYDIDEVISFFNSAGVVTFSNEPDKYYKFAIYEQIDFERLIRFKTATVVFHVQPYKYANNENPLNFAITSGVPVSVTNNGNTISKPDLMITGEGVVNLDINGEQVLNIDFGESEQTYIIDSDAMNAYATENAIKDIKTDFIASQASGTPTPSSPIPIVGVDKVNVVNCGKNLFNKATITRDKAFAWTTGAFFNEEGSYASDFIPVKAGQTYIFSNEPVSQCLAYDKDKNYILVYKTGEWVTPQAAGTFRGSITIPDGVSFIRFTRRASNMGGATIDEDANSMQMERGSTATEYEPYNGITVLINLGGTYYGGYIDVVTGKITLTFVIVDLGSLNWLRYTQTTNIPVFYATLTSMAIAKANGKCEIFTVKAWENLQQRTDFTLCPHPSIHNIYIADSRFTTAEDFKTAVTGYKYVYELETPIVVYASNTAELQAILGVNNVYSDAGDVEVTYKAGGVIHTETGEIVTFTITAEDLERGAFVNRQINGNYDNIKLKSGANTISLTGNATSLTVDKYSRWI